jgi:hypothetical protein
MDEEGQRRSTALLLDETSAALGPTFSDGRSSAGRAGTCSTGRGAGARHEKEQSRPALLLVGPQGRERCIPEGGSFRAKAEVIPALLASGQLLVGGSNFAV